MVPDIKYGISNIECLGKDPFTEFRPLDPQMANCIAICVNRGPRRVAGAVNVEVGWHKCNEAFVNANEKPEAFLLGVESFFRLFPAYDGLDGVVDGALNGVFLRRIVVGLGRMRGMGWVSGKGKPMGCSNMAKPEGAPEGCGFCSTSFKIDFPGFVG